MFILAVLWLRSIFALPLGNSDAEERLDPLVFTQPPSQLVLRWMLPVEMWQEVLGFCPLEEYATLIPACREFYLLLKQSLLELPPLTSALGGLWLVTRDPMATLVRVLRITDCFVSASDLNERMPLRLLRELRFSEGQEQERVESLLAMLRPLVRAPHKLVATFAE